MKVYIVTNYAPNNIDEIINIQEEDYVVAVDGGFDLLIKQKIKIDIVVGDMDSIKNKKMLHKYDQLTLKKEKDETDTFVAIDYAYSLSSNVYLVGGIQGPRIEHFIANLMLFDKFPNLMIIDDNSKIYLLEKGKHLIHRVGYISLFNFSDAKITLEGFKYNLNNYQMKKYDPLCISNEVENLYGEITVLNGLVLVIETIK